VLVYANADHLREFSVEKTAERVEEDYDETDEKGRRFRVMELRNTHREFNRTTRDKLWFPFFVEPKSSKFSLEPQTGWVEVLPLWDDGFEGCWTWGKPKARDEIEDLIARNVWACPGLVDTRGGAVG
jgi:adenine-specific DNA-methyltransferase